MNKSLLPLLVPMLFAGCAVSPQANQQLDEARAAYRVAAADPNVHAYAQPELRSAEAALFDAERMAKEGGDSERIEHNAYLAAQRARIASRQAEARKAEGDLAAAREERRRAELEARQREAQLAREQAERADKARQQAELARQEAEAQAAARAKQTTAAAELAAEVKRLENELADVRAKQTERGWILTLKNELLFDSGGADLKPGANRALDNLGNFLRKYPDREVAIEGFTDSAGSKDANQKLSERRAEAVREALVRRGVERSRLEARGYGPSFPVASNDTATGRQLNRRVEIVIDPS